MTAISSAVTSSIEFCHLIRTPIEDEGEVFGTRAPAEFKRALAKLAFAISSRSPSFWGDEALPGAKEAHENPHIPSGYAFLLQLIAHDIVDTRKILSLAGDILIQQNARTGRLLLDTVYGASAEQSQHAYDVDAAHRTSLGSIRRSRFRLEPKRAAEDRPPNVRMCPFRDIARLAPQAITSQAEGPRILSSDPCLADIRNDSSAMLSQLLVLFHLTHNTFFDYLSKKSTKPANIRAGAWIDILFNCTRDLVITIYHAIILKDILPRILHPVIAKVYAERSDILPFHQADAVPLEFSLGASRFGHSMISNAYVFNGTTPIDTIQGIWRSNRRRPDLLPLEKAWLADWARFFDVGGDAPNLSRRIGPSYPGAFSNFSLFPSSEPNSAGLIYRDMISGLGERVWSVFPLIEALHDKYAAMKLPHIAALMKPYRSVWRERIETWLLTQPELDLGNKITPDEARWLAEDPPLAFFIQFEAAIDPSAEGVSRKKGQHLGPLGSAIIAETIYGSLTAQPGPVDFRRNDLEGMLADLCKIHLGTPDTLANAFSTPPNSMPALLSFLNGQGAFA